MNEKIRPYQVIDFPPDRRSMVAFQDLKAGRHCMYALLEVDVTVARRFIEDYKARTGEQLSFTGYLIYCLAQAVDQDKVVQSYRKGSKKLVMFDEVDVGFMIELKKGEKHILTGHVVRDANRKTYPEIHQEIRAVQYNQVPADGETSAWFNSALLLPWPLSAWFKALFRTIVRRDPTVFTSKAGTVGISSVGMFGKGHTGWGITTGSHGLDLLVGGIAPKLVEVEGRIEPREMLSLTIVFDHDVIDGAPAARFSRRLIALIESGYGLDEEQDIAAVGRQVQPAMAIPSNSTSPARPGLCKTQLYNGSLDPL